MLPLPLVPQVAGVLIPVSGNAFTRMVGNEAHVDVAQVLSFLEDGKLLLAGSIELLPWYAVAVIEVGNRILRFLSVPVNVGITGPHLRERIHPRLLFRFFRLRFRRWFRLWIRLWLLGLLLRRFDLRQVRIYDLRIACCQDQHQQYQYIQSEATHCGPLVFSLNFAIANAAFSVALVSASRVPAVPGVADFFNVNSPSWPSEQVGPSRANFTCIYGSRVLDLTG